MAAHTLSALRVEESNNKLLESERKLQGERLRAVLLEQHLEKLRLEPGKTAPRSKTGRGQPCYKGRRLPAPHLTPPTPPLPRRSEPRGFHEHGVESPELNALSPHLLVAAPASSPQ